MVRSELGLPNEKGTAASSRTARERGNDDSSETAGGVLWD